MRSHGTGVALARADVSPSIGERRPSSIRLGAAAPEHDAAMRWNWALVCLSETITLAVLFSTGGLWCYRTCSIANPLRQALDAYSNGDWKGAAQLADRGRKGVGTEDTASRLLARALVRAGHDYSALAAYQEFGRSAMLPDDLCLLGIALIRTGDREGGLDVWAKARSREPNHPEILFELTLAHFAGERLFEAAERARAVASCRGWRDRAYVLLGAIQLTRNDPAGAIVAWQRVPEREHTAATGEKTVNSLVSRREVARALLQAQRPAEALNELKRAFAAAADIECFWLLSRAYLQEGAATEALAAQEKAGSFRRENPLVPEPSPLVGSRRCAKCHVAIYSSQQRSRHAQTFSTRHEARRSVLAALILCRSRPAGSHA
jgi:tetratricopeptide (TPR) repeat protein